MKQNLMQIVAGLFAVLLVGCGGNNTQPKTQAPGQPEAAGTGALEAGAKALQQRPPINGLDVYLVGFHPMKDNPALQMEAHHFCNQVNEDFAQCVLFDGNTAKANLNGVEYIISEKLFNTLPSDERKYWHPHNYEILSGELIGPGLPQSAEKQLMIRKMNSYGKTWHVWMTERGGKPGDSLPLGDPHLAWSFNRDGEIKPEFIPRRDQEMKTNTEQIRRDRQDLVQQAHPQSGVDDIKQSFPGQTKPIPGVTDIRSAGQVSPVR